MEKVKSIVQVSDDEIKELLEIRKNQNEDNSRLEGRGDALDIMLDGVKVMAEYRAKQ